MPFAIRGQVTGVDALVRKLNAFPAKFRGRVQRPAIQKAAKPVLVSAKANVPVDQGWLKRSLMLKVKTYRSSAVTVVIIGPSTGFKRVRQKGGGSRRVQTAFGKKMYAQTGQRPVYYAHLVEKGTKPHAIGKGSSLQKKKQSGRMHPGARPKPFLRPAWEANQARVSETLRTELAAGIERELAKG